ncbi:MAG: S-layer homology domain-containing protein [Candidatus Gracilibacteria bacterium]
MKKLRLYFSKPMGRLVALMVILGMSIYGVPKIVHLTTNMLAFTSTLGSSDQLTGEGDSTGEGQASTSNAAWEDSSANGQVQEEGLGEEDQGLLDDPTQDDGNGYDYDQDDDSYDWVDEGQTDGDEACAGWNDEYDNCYNYGEYIDMGDGTRCTMMGYNEPLVCENSNSDDSYEWVDDTQTEDLTLCTDGWFADDGRCEDYGMWNWLDGEWCVMYDNGSSECNSDQPEDDGDQWVEDSWDTTGNMCEGPDCTFFYQTEVCGNDGITYATEDEMPENVNTQYSGPCSTPDARELSDMQNNLKDEDQFGNVLKRAEHAQQYLTKVQERFAKYLAKADEKGLSQVFSDFVQEKVNLFEGYQAEIDATIAEIQSYQTLYADFMVEAQNRYDTVAAGGYGSQYFWNYTGKKDFFQIIRETLENRVSEYDNTGMYDFLGLEPVKIAYDAEKQGVLDVLDWTSVDTMQAELQTLQDTYSAIVDEMNVLKEEAVVALSNDVFSQDEMNDLRTNLWDEMDWLRWDMEDYRDLESEFWDSEPWRNFDIMWQSINWAREYSFALKDFENMQTMLSEAQNALTVADGVFTEAQAQTVIDDLLSAIENKVLSAADEAMAKAEETKNPEALWYFFDKVMQPFGNYADSQLGYLKDLFYSKYQNQVSDEDRELLVSLFENGGRNDSRDTFVQQFSGDGTDEQEIIDYIVGQMDEGMANQIIEKLMGMVSEETLQNLGSYDQQMGIDLNQLLTMSTYADPTNYQAMLTDTESMAATIADMQQQIEGLRSQNSQLQSLLDQMAQANLYGDQAEAFQSTLSGLDLNNFSTTEVAQLQMQFEEVKADSETQKFSDGLIPFKDTAEGEWYTYYAATLKGEGVVSGGKDLNGQLTGEYNPEDLVTNAEFLKMALNATGNGEAEGTPSNSEAVGHWAQGFYVQAEKLGLDLALSNPNDTASRGMVARTLNELMGNSTLSLTSGQFSDVTPGDEFANDVATISSAGVMTGNPFRPYDNLNRAEVAAVITRVMEGQQVMEFETFDTSDFLQGLDQLGPMTLTQEDIVQSIEPDVSQDSNDIEDFWKLNNLLNFLQVMTNI